MVPHCHQFRSNTKVYSAIDKFQDRRTLILTSQGKDLPIAGLLTHLLLTCPSGASWVYNMPQQTADQVAFGDQMYSHRLGNLAAIDDMVGKLIEKLDEHDLLDNTCIIYTTDNGMSDPILMAHVEPKLIACV